MDQVRHYADVDSYYNGSEGQWTVCGEPWSKQPAGVVKDCPECARLRQERIQKANAEWRGQ